MNGQFEKVRGVVENKNLLRQVKTSQLTIDCNKDSSLSLILVFFHGLVHVFRDSHSVLFHPVAVTNQRGVCTVCSF